MDIGLVLVFPLDLAMAFHGEKMAERVKREREGERFSQIRGLALFGLSMVMYK